VPSITPGAARGYDISGFQPVFFKPERIVQQSRGYFITRVQPVYFSLKGSHNKTRGNALGRKTQPQNHPRL